MPDMYEIVDAGFGYAEFEPEPAVIWRHPMPDGREATVTRTRLCLGPHGNVDGADVYLYASSMSAVLSAARWIEAECPAEPDGWTSHPGTGRNRAGGAPPGDERAWVCPHHPDRLPAFEGGRLFCAGCGREIVGAVRVPWPPAG
jgi:hypothetical protein